MTTAPHVAPHVGPHLEVEADLVLSVDGVPVRITGQGSTLVVRTSQPVAFARRLRWARGQLPVAVPFVDLARQVTGVGLRLRVGRETGPTVPIPMAILSRVGGGAAVSSRTAAPRDRGAVMATPYRLGGATGAVVLLVVVLSVRRWRHRRSG